MTGMPEDVRKTVRERVYAAADQAGWTALKVQERARLYEHWTDDPTIGGVIARYIDRGRIRLYLKDSVLKHFSTAQTADTVRPLRALRIKPETVVTKQFLRPHGRIFDDGRVIVWGRADEWKHLLMALHERTYGKEKLRAFGVVLMAADGRFHDTVVRAVVEDAAEKLLVERVVWLDT